jgi:hypothetical protein
VYDVFARSFKRFRVVITTDLRPFARRKPRADAQNCVPPEADLDSKKKIALDSKPEMKMKTKNTTKRIAKKKREKEEKKKSEDDEIDDDDERDDDVDVRIVQIAVSKQLQVQIFVIIDKRSSSRRLIKK